jgi:acylphosphatase
MTQRADELPAAPIQASLHAFVRGRVQGVGYRDFVRREAFALGLRGWVRNIAGERSVEVDATGTRAALEELVRRLRQGPRFANVTGVEVDWSDQVVSATTFEIQF